MSRHRVFGVVGSQVSQHVAIAVDLQSPSLHISNARPPLCDLWSSQHVTPSSSRASKQRHRIVSLLGARAGSGGLSASQIANQVRLRARDIVARYYDAHLASDDELMLATTRSISLRTQVRQKADMWLS